MTRTHPPLDPELATVLAAIPKHLSPGITSEDIEAPRINPMYAVTDEALRRNGTVDLRNCPVPRPPGAPGVSQ
jgi:hypothetical protein